MKIIPANEIHTDDTGYVCYLTRNEAILIRSVLGNIGGGGPIRALSDSIYARLGSHSIPVQGILQHTGIISYKNQEIE